MMIAGPDPFRNIRQLVKMRVDKMRTYQLDQPLATHYRVGTCQEVGCAAHAGGWRMGFDLTNPEARNAARWIRDKSGRTYTHELLDDGRKIVFTFAAGQRCFEVHRVPLERDPIMIVRAGDWRGNPTGEQVRHRRAEDFLDHWLTDTDKINTLRERG